MGSVETELTSRLHTDDAVAALVAALGPGRVAVDPSVTAADSRDMMPLAPSGVRCRGVAGRAEMDAVEAVCLAEGSTFAYVTDDLAGGRMLLQARRHVLPSLESLGGTVTGEHGAGRIKQNFLASEIAAIGADIHRKIKAALDPGGPFNPGSMFAT